MRTIATLAPNLLLFAALQLSPVMMTDVSGQTLVSSIPASHGESYYCAKCGTYHTRASGAAAPLGMNLPRRT